MKLWISAVALTAAMGSISVYAYQQMTQPSPVASSSNPQGHKPSSAQYLQTEYNIAKGLAPAVATQSISVIEPFEGEFRILGSKTYKNDAQAKFSPIDYAVTRGLFTEPEIARQISINQYDRFLNWRMAKPPIAPRLATQLVNNMHIIPANPEVAKQITNVKRGDLVRLEGNLVEVRDKDLVWTSALNWDGVGDGACRLIRVESIEWIEHQNI